MSSGGRSPTARCREFFQEIDRKEGRVFKWDFIKLAGNEPQFRRWVTNFLLHHKFVREIKEGSHTFYQKTDKGQLMHETLNDWQIVTAYRRLAGKRLKAELK